MTTQPTTPPTPTVPTGTQWTVWSIIFFFFAVLGPFACSRPAPRGSYGEISPNPTWFFAWFAASLFCAAVSSIIYAIHAHSRQHPPH